MFAFGEAITRQRGVPILDPYSNEQTDIDWDDPAEVVIPFTAVDDSQSFEPLEDGRRSLVSDYTLYAPVGADVESRDRVVVRGDVCEVVGRPSRLTNPFTGWKPGVVIQAKRVDG